MRTHSPHPNTGPVFYITTVVHNRLPLFTRPGYVIPLFDSLIFYRSRYHFLLLGYVCMPDHLHLLIWPQDWHDVDPIMRDFKGYTAKRRNPVRAGLVKQPEEYPYSSYRSYMTGEEWLIEVDRVS